MKELKPGDTIRIYYTHTIYTGTVKSIVGDMVSYELVGGSYVCAAHRKQVRLITKKKVKPITKEDLKRAYDKCTPLNRESAQSWVFIEELERIIGRKIK